MAAATAEEIARRYCVTAEAVRRWVRHMGCPAVKDGRAWHFDPQAVDAWRIGRPGMPAPITVARWSARSRL